MNSPHTSQGITSEQPVMCQERSVTVLFILVVHTSWVSSLQNLCGRLCREVLCVSSPDPLKQVMKIQRDSPE